MKVLMQIHSKLYGEGNFHEKKQKDLKLKQVVKEIKRTLEQDYKINFMN
jgi:hypothetical protein